MAQSAGEVAVQDRIDSEDVVALRIVHVALEGNVVEVGQVFWQLLRILSLLDDVLLLVPVPWPVDLSEVLDD